MKHSMLAAKLCCAAAALLLGACATKAQSGISTAVTAPLNDLNIVHADIPELLRQAQRQPYALPDDQGCDALSAQVGQLDAALGADLDAPASDASPSLVERGADVARNEAVGALQRTTEGIIPFRGWVRKLSGAERYSRQVSAAIAAGTARRAFLKGVRAARGCTTGSPVQVTTAAQ